jgi:hypothetical protein
MGRDAISARPEKKTGGCYRKELHFGFEEIPRIRMEYLENDLTEI